MQNGDEAGEGDRAVRGAETLNVASQRPKEPHNADNQQPKEPGGGGGAGGGYWTEENSAHNLYTKVKRSYDFPWSVLLTMSL